MKNNNKLLIASKNKADEFYTKYETIEKEIKYYWQLLNNKIVYCNCDNPLYSNFWKYFKNNFLSIGLKEIWCTYYKNGNGIFTKIYMKNNKIKEEKSILKENGDFRSKECISLLKKADVIITNPPFSLLKEFIPLLFKYKKMFLILGNQNVITYKEVYPYIVTDNLHFGKTIHKGDVEFQIPSHYPLFGTNCRVDENGNRYARVTGIRWLTNFILNEVESIIDLKTAKWNLKYCSSLQKKLLSKFGICKYLKYDNYDAYDVPLTNCIPKDYFGVIGVPLTFLDKYNPKQFKIVGFRKGNDGKDLRINGKEQYFRILIQQIV